jgi:3-keto-5-aminohexanoate cleavage enzyme
MIDMALRLNQKGFIKPPMHFNLVLGVTGGIAATARDLVFLTQSIPSNSTYTVTGIGRYQFNMIFLAMTMGGHVRVGFEDNVYLSKGVLANSNGELVEKVVRFAKELGREVASPDEARQILHLEK